MDSILASDRHAPEIAGGLDGELYPRVLAIDALHVPGIRRLRYYGRMRLILSCLYGFYLSFRGETGGFESLNPIR